MKGGTLFSGICAPEQAMPEIDWRWRSEIDPFANAVAEARHPGIPNLGSVLEIDPDAIEPVDLLVFGSPCQDFSIAGKRAGMDGERGNLTLVALDLARQLRPRWLVFENVPGLLSNWTGEAPSDLAEGEEREAEQYSDMAAFLGTVRECGYLGCWRVYDAQYAGVPQRRRRIFFVGHLGDWRPAAAVLFEPESLSGNPPPRREAGQEVARPVASGSSGGSGYRNDADTADNLIAPPITSNPYGDHESREGLLIAHSLRADGFDASEDGTGRGTPLVPVAMNLRGREGGAMPEMDDLASIRAASGGSSRSYLAFDTTQITSKANRSSPKAGDPCHPLAAGAHAPAVAFNWQSGGDCRGLDPQEVTGALSRQQTPATMNASAVRRLTPRECERLQGFPDGFTLVTYRGKPAADGPRYRALGNSMAVPVMRWILSRVLLCDAALRGIERAA